MKLTSDQMPIWSSYGDSNVPVLEVGMRVIIDNYQSSMDGRVFNDEVGIVVSIDGALSSIEIAGSFTRGIPASTCACGVIILGEMAAQRVPNGYCKKINSKKFKEYLQSHNLDEHWATAWCKNIYRMIGK